MTLQPDIPLSRQHIRQQIRERRRALIQPGATAPVCPTGRGADDGTGRRSYSLIPLALFLSFDGELDTQPLIDQLWRAGKRVYLPVLHPFSPETCCFYTTIHRAN
ncbi:hypothetical protein LNP26_14915 [Klebsiella variicola subsp. variicola]|nr:hypothetical protein [Klebsiella variicola subsp. variicola]